MNRKFFKDSFLKYCEKNNFEKNVNQLKIVDELANFFDTKDNFISRIFKSKKKLCFYLFGNVGVGKTMILDHFYDLIEFPKMRLHFNEFMINFHDFIHKNKINSISSFVKKLKKNYKLIYLDEFQVTNIVDAMILGKLFETIFKENINVFITSNITIDELYKNGLQRERFLPFISIVKENSIERELLIDDDYRKLGTKKLERAFSPINEKTNFKINQFLRELTKDKKLKKLKLKIKGRDFIISNFYDGIAKFDFKDLCDVNLGAEDYIKVAEVCTLIAIQNIPNFNEINSNQQQRFITLIDILYDKKVLLIISTASDLENLTSSSRLLKPFKRTLSRLFELTSSKGSFF